jgi:hypothetical protein
MQNEAPAVETAQREPTEREPGQALDQAAPAGGDQDAETRIKFEEEQESPEAIKARSEAVKALIAEKVRGDSRERAELTPEEFVIALHLDLRYGKFALSDLLAEMALDERYLDIKGITTVTGLFFVYCVSFIPEDEALAKSVIEEAKYLLASAIRSDSRDGVRLTPVSEIYAMAPDTDPAIIDVLLKGMPSEARYADIRKIKAVDGAVYYHCETYLTESYAVTLLLAMAGDHLATIAETIREESRIYPRTTNTAIFRDQQVYGIPPEDLDTVLWRLLRDPEYADIKRIVHPVTRAIHLYSETYIAEASAWAMMDWEEVGRASNP